MKYKWLAAAVLMVGGMGAANARTDVSIGIGLPLPGAYYEPAPVYYAPPPPVYRERVYYAPAPVYYAPAPVYYGGPRYYGPRYGRDVHYERDVYGRGYDRHVEYDRYRH